MKIIVKPIFIFSNRFSRVCDFQCLDKKYTHGHINKKKLTTKHCKQNRPKSDTKKEKAKRKILFLQKTNKQTRCSYFLHVVTFIMICVLVLSTLLSVSIIIS